MHQSISLSFTIVCLLIVIVGAGDAGNNINVSENKYSFVTGTSLPITYETDTSDDPQDIQSNESSTSNSDSEDDIEDDAVQDQERVEVESEIEEVSVDEPEMPVVW